MPGMSSIKNKQKVMIDGVALYIDGLVSSGDDAKKDFGITSDGITTALNPVAKIAQSVIAMAEQNAMSEVEVSLQLSLEIENGIPIFGLLNAKTGANVEVKVKWERE